MRKILLLSAVMVVIVLTMTLTISADEPYTPPYGAVLDSFNQYIDERANNDAYAALLSHYNGYGDARIFEVNTIMSTKSVVHNTNENGVLSNVYFNIASGNTQARINVNGFAFCLFVNDVQTQPTLQYVDAQGYIDYLQYFDGNLTRIELKYYSNTASLPSVSIVYEGESEYDGYTTTMRLKNIGYSQNAYNATDIYRFDIAFGVDNAEDCIFLPIIAELAQSSAPYTYAQKVYSPKLYYDAYKVSYNVGYDDGARFVYATAKQEGYEEGLADGIEQGKQSTVDYQEAYDKGYWDAVGQIKDGEFGSNFLSGILTAPLRAMNAFQLISWTTESGTTISISLMSIFSAIVGICLFVWFLKMFAGG